MNNSKIKKFITNKYFPLAIFCLSMFIIFYRIGLVEGTDDTWHLPYLNENGIIRWIYHRIITWQPRIYSDLAYALLIDKLTIWRILNSIQVTLLLYCITKISTNNVNDKNIVNVNYFVCCIFFFISPYVITSGMMWYTGSFNYLWPVTSMIIAIVPFIYAISNRSTVYKKLNIIFIINSILSCYNEQTLAIILCFGTISMLYLKFNKMKINKTLIIQYTLIIINGAIFLSLSQIADRMTNEGHWYAGFEMLTLIDKIFQGINWTNFHYINSSNMLMFVLSIELFLLLREKDNQILKILGMVPMVFFLFKIIPFDFVLKNFNINNSNAQYYTGDINPYKFEELLNNYIYNTSKVMPNNLLPESLGSLLPSFFGLFIMLFIPILIWMALDKKEDKFYVVTLYFAALVSGYIIGFTPTIFASGSRVFFVGNIILILITVKLFCQMLIKNIYYHNCIKYIFICLAGLIWLELFIIFARGILWL